MVLKNIRYYNLVFVKLKQMLSFEVDLREYNKTFGFVITDYIFGLVKINPEYN